jgi:hypothetical protein
MAGKKGMSLQTSYDASGNEMPNRILDNDAQLPV